MTKTRNLSEIIHKRRKQLKLTQKQVAKLVNISVRTYQRIENECDLTLQEDILNALDMQLLIIPKELTNE